MRPAVFGLAVLTALSLCACGIGEGRSYYSSTVHLEQHSSEDDASALRAESYPQLVEALLHLTGTGTEHGTIRLYQYTGDVEADLKAACEEVSQSDPLGLYAIETIGCSYTRILAYYECSIDMTFRRTAREISSVTSVLSAATLREQLYGALDQFSPVLAFRTPLLITVEELNDMISRYRDEHPELAMSEPEISVSFYEGEESEQRIVELRMDYGRSSALLLAQSQQALETINTLCADLTCDRTGLWTAFQRLTDGRTITTEGYDSVFLYLQMNEGTPKAASSTLLLLCRQLGLDSALVRARNEAGEPCFFVCVSLDGVRGYIDPTAENTEDTFLRTDLELSEQYLWNDDDLPGEPASEPAE